MKEINPEILIQTHRENLQQIEERRKAFARFQTASFEEIFPELAFCLCTPQSDSYQVWAAVERMQDDGALMNCACSDELHGLMKGIRFHITKSKRILAAREIFPQILAQFSEDEKANREILVREINGLGMKEASHFLRNIGRGEHLAILDRHILRALVELDVIDEIPKSLSPKRYLEIEEKMSAFCGEIGISLFDLDFVLMILSNGKLFK